MLNKAILMGRLTGDPELKTTPSGASVTSFSLAVERDYKSGDERKTDFITVVAWRNTAEFICRYFQKGRLMAVEGRIETRKYTDKQGNSRTAFEVVADKVFFCGDKQQSAAVQPQTDFEPVEINDEDLPF